MNANYELSAPKPMFSRHAKVIDSASPRRQEGAVLVVSLILLLTITLIGISSINEIGMNERMAGNYKDHNLAFQAAEAALAEGERRAISVGTVLNSEGFDTVTDYFSCTSSGSNCFTDTCLEGLCFTGSYPPLSGGGSSAGICESSNPATPLWETAATWNTTDRARTYGSNLSGVAEQPKYIIEFMCYVQADPDVAVTTSGPSYGTDWAYMFRITALGIGTTTQSKAMVQSTYKVLR